MLLPLQRLFDILPDSPRIFVGWLSNDARTEVTPQVGPTQCPLRSYFAPIAQIVGSSSLIDGCTLHRARCATA
jgi:hypothetical protein